MALEAAPYFADVAGGPDNGAAYWATTSDGIRIRVGAWPLQDARGSLLLMPGRTEFIEKYGVTAAELAPSGYAMMAVDWRGQGLADRLLPDRRVGHVLDFRDYQKDVAAMVAVAQELDMPRPWHVLGHSMGGAIALRSLVEGLDVKSATFTGPMWGILIAPGMRQLAWGLYYATGWTGHDDRLPPTTSIENYLAENAFANNVLTNDEPMWDHMKRQVLTYPDLALGGPSMRWVGEALRECRYLMRVPAPEIPTLTFVGEHEAIVDAQKMRMRMENWPSGRFQVVSDAQHEVLMEGPAIRTLIREQMLDVFARGEAKAAMARAS